MRSGLWRIIMGHVEIRSGCVVGGGGSQLMLSQTPFIALVLLCSLSTLVVVCLIGILPEPSTSNFLLENARDDPSTTTTRTAVQLYSNGRENHVQTSILTDRAGVVIFANKLHLNHQISSSIDDILPGRQYVSRALSRTIFYDLSRRRRRRSVQHETSSTSQPLVFSEKKKKRPSRFVADSSELKSGRRRSLWIRSTASCSLPPGTLCKLETTCCGNVCVNLTNDPNHCGHCTHICRWDRNCCNGKCRHLNNDERNCGTCGNKCSQGIHCHLGLCGY